MKIRFLTGLSKTFKRCIKTTAGGSVNKVKNNTAVKMAERAVVRALLDSRKVMRQTAPVIRAQVVLTIDRITQEAKKAGRKVS